MDRTQRMIAQLKDNDVWICLPAFPEGRAYEDVGVIRKKGIGTHCWHQGNKKPLGLYRGLRNLPF